MSDQSNSHDDPIAFAPRLVASEGFRELYDEGMTLIETVAAYLDGDGRAQSKQLDREASMLYASESMRLTTRLMQMASWLLLQRAANEGEISADHAQSEKSKLSFSAEPTERGGPGWEELPEQLKSFLDQGDSLVRRVRQLDSAIGDPAGASKAIDQTPNSIAAQFARLKQEFGSL